MSLYYILDKEHHAVRVSNLLEWARFFEDTDARRVALTQVGDVEISTVFLGIDHRFIGKGPPLLFETMVFGGKFDREACRYSTWGEAVAGHAEMVARVKEAQ